MNLAHNRRAHRTAARLLAGCLAGVLMVCGIASVRVALLGTHHVHAGAAQAAAMAAAMAGWTDFRRAVHIAGGTAAPAHTHEALQRHHHDGVDANVNRSVVSLDADAAAALVGEAPSAGGAPVIALAAFATGFDDPPRAGTTMRWPAAARRGIERIEAGRLERPPRG